MPPPRPGEPDVYKVSPAPATILEGPLPLSLDADIVPTGRLVLVGPGGAELSLGARLSVGRTVLTSKFGEGGRYASDQQFVLDRKPDGWYIEPVANTTNATLINGDVLTLPTRLTIGSVIGVGSAVSRKSKLDLTVKSG